MRRFPLAIACLFLLPLLPSSHADPGGVDAPQDRDGATEVGEGTFEGNLSSSSGDLRDRYRFAHAYGKGARVTVWSDDDRFIVESRDLNFAMVVGHSPPAPAPNGTGYQMSRVMAATGGVTFAVTLADEAPWLAYVVTVETIDIADAELVSLRVTRQPFRLTQCGVGPCVGEERIDVEMTVRAIGDLPYRGTLSIWVREGPITLASARVALEPGSTVTLFASWDPVGVGDVTIDGRASAEHDLNHANNVLTQQCTLYAGGFRGAAVV